MTPVPQASSGETRPPLQERAPVVAARFPLAEIEPEVAEFLRGKQDQTWALACSGGADSTFLAVWLAGVFGQRTGRTVLLHFDHATRSRAEHDREARQVEWLAEQLGFTAITGRNPTAGAGASEEILRAAREEFFARQLRDTGAALLLLGHQRDDVTETFLMRAARGSGVEGLAAPRPLSRIDDVARVRPLLSLPAETLRTTLRELGVEWCEDLSNAGDSYARNRLRHRVVPAWAEALGRDAGVGVARSRARLQETAEGIRQLGLELYGGSLPFGEPLPLEPLAGRPLMLWRWVLGRWLESFADSGRLQAQGFEELLQVTRSGRGQVSFGTGNCLRIGDGSISFVPLTETAPVVSGSAALSPGVIVCWPDGRTLQVAEVAAAHDLRKRIRAGEVDPDREVWVDADKPVLPLRVRCWQAGDRLQPLGMQGARKLQDIFTDVKIPRSQRSAWPVLVDEDDRVVWLPGMPPADWAAVDDGTRLLLRVRWDHLKKFPVPAGLAQG